MFKNLLAEMARNGINNSQMAGKMKMTTCTFSRKMSGKSQWTLGEINRAIEIFPGATISYLFERAPINQK